MQGAGVYSADLCTLTFWVSKSWLLAAFVLWLCYARLLKEHLALSRPALQLTHHWLKAKLTETSFNKASVCL